MSTSLLHIWLAPAMACSVSADGCTQLPCCVQKTLSSCCPNSNVKSKLPDPEQQQVKEEIKRQNGKHFEKNKIRNTKSKTKQNKTNI